MRGEDDGVVPGTAPEHPHVRGEDALAELKLEDCYGAPPLAWGGPPLGTEVHPADRSTPTCMGRTEANLRRWKRSSEHHHVRGENDQWAVSSHELNGAPPPAWGEPRGYRASTTIGRSTPRAWGGPQALPREPGGPCKQINTTDTPRLPRSYGAVTPPRRATTKTRSTVVHRTIPLAAAGVPEGSDIYSEDFMDAGTAYQGKRSRMLVGELGGKVIAMGGLREVDRAECEILRMRVYPEHQGRGFGRAILEALEEHGRQLGYTSAVLVTGPDQHPAIDLYSGSGYEQIEISQYGNLRNVRMTKAL